MAAHSRIAWRIHGQRSLAGTVHGVAKSQTRLKRLGSSHKVNGRTVSARSPASCAVRAVHQHWHWQARAHGAPTVPETFQNLCLVPGPAPPVTSDFMCSFKWKCPVKRSIREASHTRLKRAGELLVFSTQGCVPGNGSSLRSDTWSHGANPRNPVLDVKVRVRTGQTETKLDHASQPWICWSRSFLSQDFPFALLSSCKASLIA